jgi:hypothetical protein
VVLFLDEALPLLLLLKLLFQDGHARTPLLKLDLLYLLHSNIFFLYFRRIEYSHYYQVTWLTGQRSEPFQDGDVNTLLL